MGPTAQPTFAVNWARRADRARDLQADYPAAADLLRFYARVLDFQGHIASDATATANTSQPLRAQVEIGIAMGRFPELLRIAQLYGPPRLGDAAAELRKRESEWEQLLTSGAGAGLEDFLIRASLQPLAEHLQSQYPEATDQTARLCPVCGASPQLIILRPEGEGARRSLLCSFCLREWTFRRVVCSYCGELDKEKLPYYAAEECKHVRVEACEVCRRYLKSVDLSLDGLAIPLVDEVALSALDLWASERGYSKIVPNLLGL